MNLRVTRDYSIPRDLAEQYDEKIAQADKWLEEQLIALGIKPSIIRRVWKSYDESGVKARKD